MLCISLSVLFIHVCIFAQTHAHLFGTDFALDSNFKIFLFLKFSLINCYYFSTGKEEKPPQKEGED